MSKRLFLLFITTLLFSCFSVKENNKEKIDNPTKYTLVKNSLEDAHGFEYLVKGNYSKNEVTFGQDLIGFIKNLDSNTIIVVSGNGKIIPKDSILFTIKNVKTVLSKKSFNIDLKNHNISKNIENAKLLGDFDKNNIVNITDFSQFIDNYGLNNIDPNYNEQFDIYPATNQFGNEYEDIYDTSNPDGKINILDFIIFGINYGKEIISKDILKKRYVSNLNGNDNFDGTIEKPYKTIQKGIDNSEPGMQILIREGIYNEIIHIKSSGNSSEYIILENYPNESVIIDGTNISVNDSIGLINIYSKSYIIIKGLSLTNLKGNETPMGIYVSGSSKFIEILDNSIFNIETQNGNAHGIAFYGDKSESISNVKINNNEVYNCKLGQSETIVLNGNVEKFEIVNNVVHNNNNIGIDLIGFEGTCSDDSKDYARDGIVSKNKVYNIDSLNNSTYNSRSAGGIYVDGGKNIIIEQNEVFECNIGIEIASEHKSKSTSDIIIRNNLIYNNHIGGIFLGGYDRNRGSTENCFIVNNTLYNNDTDFDGNGELLMQFDCRNNVIKNNIFVGNNQGLVIGNPFIENINNIFDYNFYFCLKPNNIEFQWKKKYYTNFDNWISATENNKKSKLNDPKLIDPLNQNFNLNIDSNCINYGENLDINIIGSIDFKDNMRIMESIIDIGAFESQN